MVAGFQCSVIPLTVFLLLSAVTHAQQATHPTCKSKADIVFAIDSSHSLGVANYGKVQAFASNTVRSLTTGGPDDWFRFAVVRFADDANMLSKFSDYVGKPESVVDVIEKKMIYKPGRTATGEAFNLIDVVGFKPEVGHRPKVRKIVIVVTDGKGNTQTDPIQAAKALRGHGAQIISIGVGTDIDHDTLNGYSDNPGLVIQVKTFEELKQVQSRLQGMICGEAEKASDPKQKKAVVNPCPEGQELKGTKCQWRTPTCETKCPDNYELRYPCLCVTTANDRCTSTRCPEGSVPGPQCKCIPKISEGIKECKEVACGPNQILDKQSCTCKCNLQCNKNLFSLDIEACECVCNVKCRIDFVLDKKRCKCQKIQCETSFFLYQGRCVRHIPKVCGPHELLYKDICLKRQTCPKGCVQKGNVCFQVKCPYGVEKDGKCKDPCPPGMYMVTGHCQKIEKIECPEHSTFIYPMPHCPPTCAEPVPLTHCPDAGDPKPGCLCEQGRLAHDGKCIHPSSCPNRPLCLKNADILLMLDSSLSLGERNFYIAKSMARAVAQTLNVEGGTNERLAVMRFNDAPTIFTRFNSFQKMDHEAMLKKLGRVEYEPGLTYLGEALHAARTGIFSQELGMRTDVPRIVLLLTDGTKTNGDVDPMWEARKLREEGIMLVVFGIGKGVENRAEYLFNLVGAGGKVFVFALKRFQDIHPAVSRVITFECTPFSCPRPRIIEDDCKGEYRNIQRIEYYQNGFACRRNLIRSWKRRRCACPQDRVVVSPCNGVNRLKIIYKYTLNKKKYICTEDKVEDKIICSCPKPEITVGKCEKMFKKTEKVIYVLKATPTNDYTCEKEVSTKTERCDCPKSTVTHGDCKGGFRVKTIFRYDLINDQCIKKPETHEVRCACPPPKAMTTSCDGENIAVRVYSDELDKYGQCVEQIYVGTKGCKKRCDLPMDIFFLVDTSESIQYKNFPFVREFVASVVENLDIGRNKIRVALARFSSEHKLALLFPFYTFYDKMDAARRIRSMNFYPGQTATGAGLLLFKNHVNTATHGARAGVPKMIYILTDGEPNGKHNAYELAQQLRADHVIISVVGLGGNVHKSVLQKLASQPHERYLFEERNYIDLPKRARDVADAHCQADSEITHLGLLRKYEEKLNELKARGIDDLTSLGLQKIDRTKLAHISFDIENYFSVIAGDGRAAQEQYRDNVEKEIALKLGIGQYLMQKFAMTAASKEAKITTVSFKVDSDNAKKFVAAFKKGEIKLVSATNSPLTLGKGISYISPEALEAFRLLGQLVEEEQDVLKEAQSLLVATGDKEERTWNKESMEATGILSRIHNKLYEGQKPYVAGMRHLAHRIIKLAVTAIAETNKKLGEMAQKESTLTDWEIHKLTRYSTRAKEAFQRLSNVAKRVTEAFDAADAADLKP